MQRNLDATRDRLFDLLIIGGGITGACIARDASMRGLTVALVEQDDFSHATSAATSKRVHGGLRYLRNGEIGLIRAALHERRVWQRIAPHLVRPLSFVLPLYGATGWGRWRLSAALTLYDLLAFDKGWFRDPTSRLPSHRLLSRDDALALEPVLDKEELQGALVYHECQMHSPERLGLECIIDAVRHGAIVANHASVTGFLRERGAVSGAVVRDEINGTLHDVRARVVINATGPWVDRVLGLLSSADRSPRIRRSKGVHLVVKRLTRANAVVTQTSNGSHLMVIPWRGYSLVGTTDTVYNGLPDAVGVTEDDVEQLLDEVNVHFPRARLTRADVVHFYAGVRPLIDTHADNRSTYGASRRMEIVDHAKVDGVEGLLSTMGGKWTTARSTAERVVSMAAKKLGKRIPRTRTHREHLPGGALGRFPTFAAFVADAQTNNPQLSGDTIYDLARSHGSRLPDVIALMNARSGHELIIAGRPNYMAEVLLAVREEMALTLDDVIFRRLGLGTLGSPGMLAIERSAHVMGAELKWTAADRSRQIESVLQRFHTQEA